MELYDNPRCIACGAEPPFDEVGTVRDHEYKSTTRDEFPAVACRTCGLVFLNPRPADQEIAGLYPDDYYSYHLTNIDDMGTVKDTSFVQRLFTYLNRGRFKSRLSEFLSKPRTGEEPVRILDIGCGVGHQLDILKELIPDAETYGVEINNIAAEKASAGGHQIFLGMFEDVEIPDIEFDIIISVHVIEHVADPEFFLKKAAGLLAEDGLMLIETPNTDCIDFRLFKARHWGGYHAPRHLYIFNRKSFSELAQNAGLRVSRHEAYGMSVFWNWTAHSVLTDKVGAGFADTLFPPIRIYFGGLQSFLILGFFAVFEKVILAFSGQASSFWTTLRKESSPSG